ncbi:Lrp/AsnC family transcriptional regulator [Alcaligenes sp. Lyrl_28]|uniref:Lrp/AsnC family transcriptional regulator n=1 Tax=Alcaligenes sp. Lyrl_28 TaxID=3110924 RepID=UPI003F7B4C36
MTNTNLPLRHTPVELDAADRPILNRLQEGFPICSRPFAQLAPDFGLKESELIARVQHLHRSGVLTRFGPLFQIEALGGAYCLAAMAVPEKRWESTVKAVNRHPEVAHNYRRTHALNMWFVLAAASMLEIESCLRTIEVETGLPVFAFPKEREYLLSLKLEL